MAVLKNGAMCSETPGEEAERMAAEMARSPWGSMKVRPAREGRERGMRERERERKGKRR